MNQSKTIPILLTVIAVLFVSILVILAVFLPKNQLVPVNIDVALTPTTEPTSVATKSISTIPSDWKTYENKQYRFSFQYPQGYQVEELNKILGFDNKWGLYIKDPNTKVKNIANELVTKNIAVFSLASNFSSHVNDTDKKTIKIGNNIYKYYNEPGHGEGSYNYETSIGKNKFVFITSEDNYHQQNKNFFQILSTFKSTQ